MGRSKFGRAVESSAGESITAVPAGSDEILEEAIKRGRPQWRVEQNCAIIAPLSFEFVRKEPRLHCVG